MKRADIADLVLRMTATASIAMAVVAAYHLLYAPEPPRPQATGKVALRTLVDDHVAAMVKAPGLTPGQIEQLSAAYIGKLEQIVSQLSDQGLVVFASEAIVAGGQDLTPQVRLLLEQADAQ